MSYRLARLGEYMSFSNGRSSPERSAGGAVPVFGSNGIIGYAGIANAPPQTTVIGRVGTYCGSLHFAKEASWVTDNAIKAIANARDEAHFWHYALISANLNRLRSGSGQPLINQRSLNIVEVHLPPKSERLAIGNLLGALDDKIELNRRMNETLEAMAQAIFRDWFVDFGPTRRKIEGATDPVEIMGGLVTDPGRARPLGDLFPSRFGDNGLPERWEERRLEDIATQHTSVLAPFAYPDETFAHHSIPAFDKDQNPSIDLGSAILSNKTIVPAKAVLLSKLNPDISRVWLPDDDFGYRAICSTEFLAYAARAPFGRTLLYSLFSSDPFRSMLVGMVTGTSKSHQRVSPKALTKRVVLVAGKGGAAAFEALAGALLERVQHNRAESRTLAATRDLLLPKLMSGEIRLRDAEAYLEAAQ